MQNKYTFFIVGILLLTGLKSNAQYDNVWAFGESAGIDFNSNPPRAIKTSINTVEGSASICDDHGKLLFYTDGTYVWNRDHQIMQNGNELIGGGGSQTSSTTQAAVIVPAPGSEQRYYVFSLTSAFIRGSVGSIVYAGDLYYSIVDMTLDNGKGGVIAERKGKLLDTALQERMIAVPDDDCNMWLLNVSWQFNQLRAHKIDFNGIDTVPIISKMSPTPYLWLGSAYALGGMGISPDRSKLAITQGNLTLYDFDVHSGTISNERILDDNRVGYYSVAFSLDNTKLYATSQPALLSPTGASYVFQFNVSSGDATAIRQSMTGLELTQGADRMSAGGGMQRGPDGKIYLIDEVDKRSSLGVINKPNLPGRNCDFKISGFHLLPGTKSSFGLPTPVMISRNNYYRSKMDTVFCADSFLITANSASGTEHTWEDGTTGENRQVHHSGTYWVRYKLWKQACEVHVDTFHVTIYNIPKYYATTTFTGKCHSDTSTMVANNLDQNHYLWEDSITTGKTRKVNRTGVYWVSYQSDSVCAHYVDSFIVNYPEKDPRVSFLADTLLCEKDPLQLKNTSDPAFNSFTWRLGNQDSSLLKSPEYGFSQAGTYTVTLEGKIDGICKDTASKTIVVDARLPLAFQKTPDSICAGSFFSFYQDMEGSTVNNLQWRFGDGTDLISLDNIIQHAYTQAGSMSVSLDATFRACPANTYTDTVYVYALPLIDLGPDQALCPEASPIYLKNLLPESQELLHYLWNTGDTTAGIRVKQPGTYNLQVRSGPLGCSNTESVRVHKDCYLDIPNAFTPDGGGINDYFFPRQWLSQSVRRFNLQILNRWGQTLFESNNPGGRGWDGRYNGKEQPAGVYVYLIEVSLANGRQEHYKGNVTLIR